VSEIQKVFINEKSKFYTVAKDAKVQITFNPNKVESYRLIGYENRKLKDEEFEDDEKDGGEIGAGQTITALYELVLTEDVTPERYAQFDFRYKMPKSDTSRPLSLEVNNTPVEFNMATESTRFAIAVAGFGLLMRESEYKGSLNLQMVQGMAESATTFDPHGYRKEFVKMADAVGQIK
jgi:Ca-activated chloride channel family protein